MAVQVAFAIREAVQAGRLVPDVLYSAYQLAEQLGVSRSPVREALVKLEEAGLVRFERNRGFRLTLPDPDQVAEIFAIRLALELPAVYRVARAHSGVFAAALRAELDQAADAATAGAVGPYFAHDQRVHDLILQEAGNRQSREIVTRLRDRTRLLGASTAEGVRSLEDIEREHHPIVEAVLRGDPAAAREAMRVHLTNTGKLLVQQQITQRGLSTDADTIWAKFVDTPV